MNTILSINDLTKTYHDLSGEVNAIKDINIDIYENEFLVLIGPSGCGKSTILSILASLDNNYKGHIKYNSDNIKIGYMLQDDALFPWLTVKENCYLGLKINNLLNRENIDNVNNLIKEYGLYEFRNKYPRSLSGGMRQRVALIRTLATNPDILLLDEPFSKLDYQTRIILSNDIYNIVKSSNKTVIMVTHDLAEGISLADRIVVLSKRPCTIKNIYDIDIGRESPIDRRKSKEFSNYYDLLWRDIDAHI